MNSEIPVILLLEDMKKNISDEINKALKAGIPCYFIEPALKDILSGVHAQAFNEVAQLKAQQNTDGKN